MRLRTPPTRTREKKTPLKAARSNPKKAEARNQFPRVKSRSDALAVQVASFHTNNSADWSKVMDSIILKRFKEAAKHVKAYREFLDEKHIDPDSINKPRDIPTIPPITKKNYLRAHRWEDLCHSDSLKDMPLVLTATSGSTGEPFYIPRADDVHRDAETYHWLFLERSGLDPRIPTLVIVGFGMGVWIGGMITYEAFHRISRYRWPLTILTPGVNKKEIFDALNHIGSSYKQLVLCGYPPFIKDLIDDGVDQGIKWEQWNMRVVCAAEAFSEHFRDHIMQKIGAKDPYRSIMNIYGSAELGSMATETPLSILLRRLAIENRPLYAKLFSEAHRLPTLAQFVPSILTFEAGTEGQLYVTGGGVLPFVRYDIGDKGGVFSFADAERMCKESGIDLPTEAKRAGIADTVMELPFVYLYERADLSTKLYGAIIYPEHIKIGLQKKKFERLITGRFSMTTEYDPQHNEYLELNIELRPDVKVSEAERSALVDSIVKSLSASSGEYLNNHRSMPGRVTPHLVFWPHEHPKYFPPGIKQKWVIPNKV